MKQDPVLRHIYCLSLSILKYLNEDRDKMKKINTTVHGNYGILIFRYTSQAI